MRGAKEGSRGSLLERFERKYIPEPNSGCWLWIGANSGEGKTDDRAYGCMNLMTGKKSAHHVSYELHKGDVPEGLQVLHHCDTPCCVNPEHLFLGTTADNMQDMYAKGRYPTKQSARNRAKLNPEKAFAIRWHAAIGEKHKDIAAQYGVTRALVSSICRNEIWQQEAHD